jgi:uncharacterized protein (DUF488 family)
VKLFTIGFTKKSARRFFEMLKDAGVKRVVDVRLNNVSQLAGFAKRDDLAFFLSEICGIEYVHGPDLAPTQEILEDYRKKRIDWETYEARFLEVMKQRRIEQLIPRDLMAEACLLCSEHRPERCHRRLVAEYLAERWNELEIVHLE